MAAKNRDYWKERFLQIEQAEHRRGAQCYAAIEKQYKDAQRQIESQIAVWYQRFADNNRVTMEEARKLLKGRELEELKWDVNEYIRYGKANAVNAQWIKQLENASVQFHINRLTALHIQMQQSLEAMFGKQAGTITGAMTSIYKDGFYRTVFEIQKGFGVGCNLAALDERTISKVINKPWVADGKNFSERVWDNRQKLVNELNMELNRNIILGRDPQKAIDAIAKKMNVSKHAAGRLVMTEQAFFSEAAQHDSFGDLGVRLYEIVATLDSRTSEICRNMDGKIFPMPQWEVGVTAPPFHVYCRSTTVPAFGDEFDLIGERAARGEDGKAYYVSADMTYKEWQKAFVNGERSGLQIIKTDDTIKEQGEIKRVAEELKVDNFSSSFAEKGERKNTQTFIDYVNGLEGVDVNVVALFNRMGKLENIESNGIPFKISHAKKYAVTVSSYKDSGNIAEVKLTIPKLYGDDLAGQVNTILHEEMHLMDLYGRQDPQKCGNWFSTCRKPLVHMFKNTSDFISDEIVKLFKEHDLECIRIESEVNSKYMKMISELNESVMNRTFTGNYNREYKKIIESKRAEKDYLTRNIMGGGIGNLQDIYDALSGGVLRDEGKLLYGHGSLYYANEESRIHETIANYAALSVTRPDLIRLLRIDKPELVAELDATIADLLKKASG